MQAKRYYYWNLHRGAWSQMERGKVTGRFGSVVMDSVEFRVRPGGRERVLAEGKKNVHAFAIASGRTSTWPAGKEGALEAAELNPAYRWVELTYNPYKHEGFVRKDNGEPIKYASMAVLTVDKRVFARGID